MHLRIRRAGCDVIKSSGVGVQSFGGFIGTSKIGSGRQKLLSMANQVDPEVINVIKDSPSAVPSFLRSAKGLSKKQWEELEKAAIKMSKAKK